MYSGSSGTAANCTGCIPADWKIGYLHLQPTLFGDKMYLQYKVPSVIAVFSFPFPPKVFTCNKVEL